MVLAMRQWIRVSSTGFVARAAPTDRLGGRPAVVLPAASDGTSLAFAKEVGAAAARGDRSLWAFITNDCPDLPSPHDRSLVTRFCETEQQFATRAGKLEAMSAALCAEGFDVPKWKSTVEINGGSKSLGGVVLGWRFARVTRPRSEADVAIPDAPPPQQVVHPLFGREVEHKPKAEDRRHRGLLRGEVVEVSGGVCYVEWYDETITKHSIAGVERMLVPFRRVVSGYLYQPDQRFRRKPPRVGSDYQVSV